MKAHDTKSVRGYQFFSLPNGQEKSSRFYEPVLTGTTVVILNGTPAAFTVESPTAIKFKTTVPTGATTGPERHADQQRDFSSAAVKHRDETLFPWGQGQANDE